MRLAIGARFATYEIVSPIGSGGMGEVYRARDTRLKRDVALKVLASTRAENPDRLDRFEREAELLAALNHPNVAAIYGVEEADGISALVLELVEGHTLADRLVRGPLPIREALVIGRQIIEALDAAHEKGIVHRDLKPANIKVREDGTVKVLDFGLAKALESTAQPPAAASTESMMARPAMTETGVILGTAAYMSPEQARGQRIDKRTDIWAFGCVLYEILTGRQIFASATVSDTIVAILQRDPDWSQLPPSTPPYVRRLLRQCLEKDPKQRLREIADARRDLEDVSEGDSAAVRTASSRAPSAAIGWSIATVATVAFLVSLLIPYAATRRSTETPPISRTMIVLPDEQELTGRGYPFALSPDGTRVVYEAASGGTAQLYIRRLADLEPTPMPGTNGASSPFFSPDGTWVAFVSSGLLQKTAVDGGTPIQIGPVGGAIVHGSWSRDGTIVFAVRGEGLFTVAAAGGTPRAIPNSRGAEWPDVLPDGKTVLTTWAGTALVVVSLDSGNRRVIAVRSDDLVEPNAAGIPWLQEARVTAPRVLGAGYLLQARYVRTGHIVYGQSPGIVRAVAFDPGSASIRGTANSLLDSVYQAPSAGAVYFSIADTGVFTYVRENRRRGLVWVDRQGRATPIGDDREAFRQPRLAPDGARAAVAIDSETRRSDIWIYDLRRSNRTRLTSVEHNLGPVWSADGARVFFYRSGQLAGQPVDGRGSAVIVHPGPNVTPSAWAPDGGKMLFTATDAKTGGDIWEVDIANHTRQLMATPSSETRAIFSPDGRWVSFSSNESGRFEVYVSPYPDLAHKVPMSNAGGLFGVWSSDGREFFYRQNFAMMAVSFDTRAGLPVSPPRLLFSDLSYAGVGGDLSFDVAPDGRFLMIKDFRVSESRHFVVVSNWFDDLTRRMVDVTK